MTKPTWGKAETAGRMTKPTWGKAESVGRMAKPTWGKAESVGRMFFPINKCFHQTKGITIDKIVYLQQKNQKSI